jgi:2-dehydro-3-deoxyphosphogluconate aldolase/(4S)-4-hydroxy-2-oxoglutarate aldolase
MTHIAQDLALSSLVHALVAARIIPVLRYGDAAKAAYAAEVAIEAGCRAIELTWTTPDVLDVLIALRKAHGDTVKIGVGTVLNAAQANDAVKAGADFLVSPGLVPDMVTTAHAAGALALVGAFTPSEVLQAHQLGADVVKMFPAVTGGPGHLKALASVFPKILFCPTGGVTAHNAADYLAAGAALLGMGSNLYNESAFVCRDTAALVDEIKAMLAALPPSICR